MNCVEPNPILDGIIDNCDYLDVSDVNSLRHTDKDLLILQLNIRGLLSKQDLLKQLLTEFKVLPDIVLLCETWLKKDTAGKLDMPNYKCYHKHRIDRLCGGVSVLVKQKLRLREQSDLVVATNLFEYNVVELKMNTNNILIVSGYRPPNSNTRKFMQEYKTVLAKLKESKHHESIVGMDHNFDLLKSTSNSTTSMFLNLNVDRDLTPCITKPTRVTNKTATLIDNILISTKLQYNYTPFVITDDLSDHYPSLVILNNIEKCKRDKVKITKRRIDSASIELIKTELDSVDWTCIDDMDVKEAFKYFHTILLNSMDEHCPKREYSISYDKIIRDPWITKGLSNSIRKQKKLYLKQLHSSDPSCTNKYKSYRNVLKKLLRRSKLDYFNNKCLEYKQNSKKLWQLINQVINKIRRKSQVIESLKIDNLVRYSPLEITKGFCNQFATVGKTYSDKVQPPRVLVETYNEKINMSNISMFLSPTDREEIKSLIMNLPAKNNSGCDDISNNLLKKLCPSLLSPLEKIFNKSLNEGAFPELMKLADILQGYMCRYTYNQLQVRPDNGKHR